MNVDLFLNALSDVAVSPYALVGYVVVAIIWGIGIWRNHKLKIIGDRLEKLPEKDRLKALELEYRLIPKGGLDSESFLKFNSKQNNLIIILVAIAAAVLIVSLAIYKSIEDNKLASAVDTLTIALNITKLGKESAENNEFVQAAGSLESVLEVYPSAAGYMNLGYVYEEISNTDSALQAYIKALSLDPDNPKILNSIGYLYKDLGELERARDALKSAIVNSAEGSEIWFMAMVNLGNVEYETGRKTNNPEKRQEHSQVAIEKYFAPAMNYKGIIKNQDFVAKTLANIGNCYKDIQKLDLAEDYLTEALSIKRRLSASRSLADSLVNMADLKLKKDQFNEAKPFLLEAIGIFSVTGNELGIGVGYYNLGDIHWAIGETEEARKYYQRSVDSLSVASLGGEYKDAPRRRLQRMANNDPPEFVIKSWQSLGMKISSTGSVAH